MHAHQIIALRMIAIESAEDFMLLPELELGYYCGEESLESSINFLVVHHFTFNHLAASCISRIAVPASAIAAR